MSHKNYDYCGICFIGGGSSHSYADTPEKAANRTAAIAKHDWGRVYEFEKEHCFNVCVYDMKEHNGWYADHRGVFDTETDEQIPVLKVLQVIV